MGAILAILGDGGDPELKARLERMSGRSPYRGQPEILIDGPLALGIQTLGSDASLVDTGNWIVAFHGFVGNWRELASERSWQFEEPASDAARIAIGFEDLGERLFGLLRGEWAVLIWNRWDRELVVARDVIGCRPLFAHRHEHRLYLATEIRQVLAGSGADARCDPAAAADYHLVRFPETGRTLYETVRRLSGGFVRSIQWGSEGFETNDSAFWNPPAVDPTKRSTNELAEEVRLLIDTAVKRTMGSSSAVSLSGGMDSSSVWGTLVSIARSEGTLEGRFRPYSNVYPGLACDEAPYIRAIHEFTGIDGTMIDTSSVLASKYLDELSDRVDQPHMPNALPVELVCEAAASDGHSVLLTGLGGDEWLGGSLSYIRELFYSFRFLTALRDVVTVRLPARLGSARQRAMLLTPGLGVAARMGLNRRASNESPRNALIRAVHRNGGRAIPGSWSSRLIDREFCRSKVELVRFLDHLASGSILEFVEQQAAWHGLEVRHPLTDLDIVEFGFAVQPRALVGGRCHKMLMRRAMADRLPPAVTERIETTVFTPIFAREYEVLQNMPPADNWCLTRLGVIDEDFVGKYVAGPWNDDIIFQLVRLWWLEVFVQRNFPLDATVV